MRISGGQLKSNIESAGQAAAKPAEKSNVKNSGLSFTPKTVPANQKNPAPSSSIARPQSAQSPANISPQEKTAAIKNIFKENAASLGLPRDTLSIALLIITRFFSLSQNPELMKSLRREILGSGNASSPDNSAENTALETELMARVLAADKGVVLSSAALKHYAAFLGTPETLAGQAAIPLTPAKTQDEKGEPQDEESEPTAEELRIMACEQADNDELLALLNAIPGKNRQHWLIFPFIIKVKGTELKVFIRLLKRELVSLRDDGFIIIDISGPKRQWRCFLKENDGNFSADIRVYPEYRPRALRLLQKEAERVLGEAKGPFGNFKGFDEVLIRNSEQAFSWADDLCTMLCLNTESLPSINKEV